MNKVIREINYWLDKPLEWLFGEFDWHIVNPRKPITNWTSKGYSYRIEVGRVYRCRDWFYPMIRHVPGTGNVGCRVTCDNRIVGHHVTLYFDQVNPSIIDIMVNASVENTAYDIAKAFKQ